MNFESLYQQAKWKKMHQKQLENSRESQIKQLSAIKKINPHSSFILANKIYEQLSYYDDEELINIETSIPILHNTHILQAIQNIQSAKEKLDQGQFQNSRLRDEANFVYCLWKMIDEEEIETRELKQIILLLHDRPLPELKKILLDMYKDEQHVLQFMETWKVLVQNNKYYKSVNKAERKDTKKNEKQIEKVLEGDQALREKCFKNQFKNIQECFLKQSQYESKTLYNKVELYTTESNYSSKNKENHYIDKAAEKQLVQRLYQNDRYELRIAQKKIEDEKRARAQMENCTFYPVTNHFNNRKSRSVSRAQRSRSVNGFDKSVNRMKVGIEKQRIQKEKKEYKPAGQNYYKLREKKINPPKFLERKKKEDPVIFMIEFDIGRHKIKVKVHQNDSNEAIAKNLCKIYCLRGQYYEQIKLILEKEREKTFLEG